MIYRYIYKITCTAGSFKDKFYFGQHTTDNLDDGYKGTGTLIKKYYKKHPNDYIKEIISFHNTQEELNQAEYDIILPWLNNKMCLNLKEGGGNNKLSEETKSLISYKRKFQVITDEHKKHISESNIGKHHSEETKKKMSESMKGKNKGKHHSDESRQKMKESAKNRPPQSEETKKKHSESMKKYINEHPEEMELRYSKLKGENNGMYGKHHSDESRQKMKESQKNRYKDHPGVNKGKHRTVVDGHIRYI